MRFFVALFLLFAIKCTTVFCQQFSPEQQNQLDSLNAILNNKNSHDTSKANAYVMISEILFVSHFDTIIPLCSRAQKMAEKTLSSNPSTNVKNAMLKILAGALNNIGYVYHIQGDIHKALEFMTKSMNIDNDLGNKQGVAVSLNTIGVIYESQGDIPKALEYLFKSLKMKEDIGDRKSIAYSLNNIGSIYEKQGDIPKALDFYGRSLSNFEELYDKKGMAMSLNNLALIYQQQGDISSALSYFKKSLNIYEEIGDKHGMAYAFNNMAGIYKNQGDLFIALDYYNKSLSIHQEIKNKKGIASGLSNIGLFYKSQGDNANALKYFAGSLHIREEMGDKKGIASSLMNIGDVYISQKSLHKALSCFTKAMQISKELGFPENIKMASKGLAYIYREKGNYKLALENYELYIQMRDSINNQETQKASLKSQLKYQFEKKAIEDSLINAKEMEIKNRALSDKQIEVNIKRKQQYALFGGLLLVVLFAVFLYNRFSVTRKQKMIIEEQKVVVEEKQKEIVDSINYAKRIQQAILPSRYSLTESLKNGFVVYKPKDIVAGDFYWLERKNDCIFFAAADCTGHGVPGALVSVVCSNALSKSVLEENISDPGKILDRARELVIERFSKSEEDVKDGMDISLCAYNPSTQTLRWAGANNPLWLIRNGELIVTRPDVQPIGKSEFAKPFTTHTIEIEKGDTFYLFTDGYQDQFGGPKGKKFKSTQLMQLLLFVQEMSMDEQGEYLSKQFETWRGNLEQVDDVCIIGVRI